MSYSEAPLSYTVKVVDPNGFDEMFTVRGEDSKDYFAKILALKKWLLAQGYTPTGNARRAPAPTATNGNGPAPSGPAPVCQFHGPMKPSTKGSGWYCPSKMADGTYCKATAAAAPVAN